MEKATLVFLATNFAMVSLFLILFSLGLSLRFRQVINLWKQTGLLLQSFLAALIVVPVIALVVTTLFDSYIPPSTRVAILVMGSLPSAPLILKMATQKVGKFDFIAPLQLSLAGISIISIPLTFWVIKKIIGIPEGWDLSYRELAAQIFQAQIFPLILGLIIREFWSDFADDIQKPITKLANGCFVAVVLLILSITLKPIWMVSSQDIISLIAIIIAVILSILITHLIGVKTPDKQAALAIVSSMRNTGLALILVKSNAPFLMSTQVSIVTYALLTGIFTSLYAKWVKKNAVSRSSS